ncbi:hypothetical protein AVEN_250341-1 [Araneus ventricosus]|uniref:Uncharacterized protein n=1 Tax=Araneus ventricosus TaxID=182803 RepID=A0A4Y2JWY0_ARAVE|nr:hypothetical protein AVEN_250341-1 [Araneus ventricosus]
MFNEKIMSRLVLIKTLRYVTNTSDLGLGGLVAESRPWKRRVTDSRLGSTKIHRVHGNPAATPQRFKKELAEPVLQLASSDSSAESEIAKAESLSRRNHLQDEMRWRAVGMLQAGARESAVARELNVNRSVIHRLLNLTKGIKTPVEDVGLDAGESPQRQTICCNVPNAGGH